MNKKILVVGGCGYVGGYLTDKLSKLSRISATDALSFSVYDNLCYEKLYLKDVDFIYGDVRDYNKLSKIINKHDIIVWLAALVGDGACAVDPALTKSINEDSVKWLVDNFKGKIIYPSTCSVYGINHSLINEAADTNPLSVYASTKLNAEQYIIKNCKNYLVFRLGTLFGISDQFSRIRLDLVANILAARAAIGETLEVFGGEQWRPLLHVKDVSRAIIYGINYDLQGLYNLSYENFKICDIAEYIKQILQETKIKFVDLKFEDMRNYKVSNEKILATGWTPAYSLKTGIEEIISIVQQKRVVNIYDPVFSNVVYLKSKIGEIFN